MKLLLYPDNWQALATEIKEANFWCCASCGTRCQRPGEFNLGWQYRLTLAHICQDYEGEAVYVAALCLPCHLAYDAPHSWIARSRWQRVRRRVAGQLELAFRQNGCLE